MSYCENKPQETELTVEEQYNCVDYPKIMEDLRWGLVQEAHNDQFSIPHIAGQRLYYKIDQQKLKNGPSKVEFIRSMNFVCYV